jgi:hypothetical protein
MRKMPVASAATSGVHSVPSVQASQRGGGEVGEGGQRRHPVSVPGADLKVAPWAVGMRAPSWLGG